MHTGATNLAPAQKKPRARDDEKMSRAPACVLKFVKVSKVPESRCPVHLLELRSLAKVSRGLCDERPQPGLHLRGRADGQPLYGDLKIDPRTATGDS